MAAKPVGMINLATNAPSKTIEKLLNQRLLALTGDRRLGFRFSQSIIMASTVMKTPSLIHVSLIIVSDGYPLDESIRNIVLTSILSLS